MSAFRSHFYEALQAMLRAINEPLLLDQLPINSPHNITARILRHGVAVSAFAMLERYSKSVFEAIVSDLSSSSMLYRDFPDKIKQFVTVDAIAGLSNSAYFIRDFPQKLTFIETNISTISLFKENTPTYTHFGFSPSGSNVGHEDLRSGFSVFSVKDTWGKLKAISTLIGATYISLEEEYKSLARARHTSAHDPAGNIPTSTLEANVKAAIVLGITVDLLGSGVGRTLRACNDKSKLEAAVNAVTHSVRFLDEQLDGTWGERHVPTGRIIKKYPNKPAGKAGVAARAGQPAVIVRNATGIPIELA